MDTRATLQERVTEFSPELQRLKKIDSIVTDMSDGMSDLHEREITAISLFRAFDASIIPIPGVMCFMENFMSLRRSRDRLGRQEFVNVLKHRPSYVINPYFDEPGGQQKEGIGSRIMNFFRRKPRGSE